jgi:hypothetical protein
VSGDVTLLNNGARALTAALREACGTADHRDGIG